MASPLDLARLDALAAHPVCAALRDLAGLASAAVVGGTVRDLLLDRPHPDLDVCVSTDPEAVSAALCRRLGGSWFALGFGTVRYAPGRSVVPRAFVDLALRHGATWDDDLRRRDLTINAMGLVITEGGAPVAAPELLDPTGGLADLQAGRIRATGRAALEADPVRLLRVFRFGATLGFAVDPVTRAWVAAAARLLADVSIERTRDELVKLLACRDGTPYLGDAADTGLLEVALPDLAAAREAASSGRPDDLARRLEALRAFDLLLSHQSPLSGADLSWLERHLADCLAGSRPRAALARAALLLRGLATPLSGQAERLRLASVEVRFLARVDRGLAAFPELQPGGAALLRYFKAAGAGAPAAAVLALADHLAARGFQADHGVLETTRRILAEARNPSVTARRPPLLRGNELMEDLGIEAGPQLAWLLARIAEERAEGRVNSPEEALALARSLSISRD